MRGIASVILALLVCLLSDAKPTKPMPPTPKTKKVEIIRGETNWGNLSRNNVRLSFNGHPEWDGDGELRADGRVFILWTKLPSLRPAPGVYTISPDGTLVGKWGYSNDVDIDEKGNIVSRNEDGSGLHDDHVRRPKKDEDDEP